jgi:hypothetical protein
MGSVGKLLKLFIDKRKSIVSLNNSTRIYTHKNLDINCG